MSFSFHVKTAERSVYWPDMPEYQRDDMENLVSQFEQGNPIERPVCLVGPSSTFSVRWGDVREMWIED